MISAIIKGGVVVNIIKGSVAGSIDITARDPQPQIGWTYDAQADTFSQAAPPPRDLGTRITPLAFQRRFTPLERTAIRNAAASNDELADFVELAKLARFIDLTDPDTLDGLQTMESVGLLSAGRAAEITNGTVTEAELP